MSEDDWGSEPGATVQAPPKPEPKKAKSKPPKSAYDAAFEALLKRPIQEVVQEFIDLLEKHPNAKLIWFKPGRTMMSDEIWRDTPTALQKAIELRFLLRDSQQ